MAEQSSVAVVIRAVVMLGCLVAIPLVAVFGNALPEAIDGVMGTWWTPRTVAVEAETAEEAPLFEPLLRNGPQSVAPEWPTAEQPSAIPSERQAAPADAVACDADGCRVLPATYEAAVGPSGGRGAALVSPSQERPPATGEFQAICDRLKELGATYVLLESWGDRQEQFRFYCKIAIAGNPNYTYRFEATSPAPLSAMAEVLQQVENWRAARYGN